MPTLWSPDTCGCQIELDPHPDDPDGKVIHRRTAFACPKHATLGIGQAHADAVLDHNRKKNFARAFVGERLGKEVHGTYDRSAAVGADPVIILGHGLTGADLAKLQADVDAQFGAGNVVVKE